MLTAGRRVHIYGSLHLDRCARVGEEAARVRYIADLVSILF